MNKTARVAGSRTWSGFLPVLLAVAALAFGQVVENPAKPKAAGAGRVVVPQDVLAISDVGTDDLYFKYPGRLKTTPDGSLLVRDVDQVLHFDRNGKFLRNLFKKGQGPGELTQVDSILAIEKSIIVKSNSPNKLIFFDASGKFEKEIPIRSEGRTSMTALLCQGGAFYFKASEYPQTQGNTQGFVDVSQTIVALNEATGETKTLSSFMTKSYVVSSGGRSGRFEVNSPFAVTYEQKLLAITHTEEYLLKIYDPAADKVVREFRRAYERVKAEPLAEEQKDSGFIIDGKYFSGPPELKFQNDVKNFFTRGQDIWAVTSTRDKAKGILIDVFDGEGVYRDCFWLKLPEAALKSVLSPGSCALDGDSLWVVERSEDETFAIKKYRVVI